MNFKKIALSFLLAVIVVTAFSQKPSSKKYNSIMWEISGKGLTKKSYLFGTMHVSNKLAFNLSDTFYNAIKRVDAIAIEINPLSWQEDYTKSIFNKMIGMALKFKGGSSTNNYITKSTYQFTESDEGFKNALSTDPEVLNHFLYRNYTQAIDFEENTYLDMHIFQCAKKLNKYFYGLENFEESEQLMFKGIKAQALDVKKKSRSTEADEDDIKSSKRSADNIEDAYRNGDLDLLDSLSRKISNTEAFNEFFLDERNKIHANEIDRIIKKGQNIFAAVGAAHLPGNKGVIELLRAKGYTLKPVFMGLQISNQRDAINKIKIPVTFKTYTSPDGLFSVDVPGKLYSFPTMTGAKNEQLVYADFTNGAYYMVSRIASNSLLWSKNENQTYAKIDSLLYENIPGKILQQTPININGYKGFNIVNKTRKGDVQRYTIIVTPLEVLFFKMSGFENYVQGIEGNTFFNSIKIAKPNNAWEKFMPEQGGFSILLPNKPIKNNDLDAVGLGRYYFKTNNNSENYEAYDSKSDVYVLLSKKNIQNYDILEEDTFNLALANESLFSGALFTNYESRTQATQNNIPYIETKGKFDNNYRFTNRIFLVGNNYYAVIVKHKNDSLANKILQSFNYATIQYTAPKSYIDSTLHLSVKSAFVPDSLTTEFIKIDRLSKKIQEEEERLSTYEEPYWKTDEKFVFSNDTTHEEVVVNTEIYPKYYSCKDSAAFWKNKIDKLRCEVNSALSPYLNNINVQNYLARLKTDYNTDYDFYIKESKVNFNNNQTTCNVVYADTNSSQTIKAQFILKGNVLLTAYTFTNTLTPLSTAQQDFFNTLAIIDNDTSFSIYKSKSNIFFKDFYSTDSTISKFAKSNIERVRFTQKDLPLLTTAINNLSINTKKYFDTKTALIKAINDIEPSEAISDTLQSLYVRCSDTATFQNAIITAMSNNLHKKSYKYLANIIDSDPPIFDNDDDAKKLFTNLQDSMQLTKTILPQVLQLVNLDDYKIQVYNLLEAMLDSNIITTKDYESIYNKIYFDAKIELKKIIAANEKRLTNKDEDNNSSNADYLNNYSSSYNSNGFSTSNNIKLFAKLLIPFWNSNQNVEAFFNKLLTVKNTNIKLDAAMVLDKNNKPVLSTIWSEIANDKETQIDLLNYAISNKKIYIFPAELLKQSLACKNILSNNYKKDSLEYLNIYLPISLKAKKGNVYFYKYKNNEKDIDWKIAYCGVQPLNTNEVTADNTFKTFSDKILKTNKTIEEQVSKIIKEEQYSDRKSSSKFLDSSNYSNLW